jgi:hypothetical protein
MGTPVECNRKFFAFVSTLACVNELCCHTVDCVPPKDIYVISDVAANKNGSMPFLYFVLPSGTSDSSKNLTNSMMLF